MFVCFVESIYVYSVYFYFSPLIKEFSFFNSMENVSRSLFDFEFFCYIRFGDFIKERLKLEIILAFHHFSTFAFLCLVVSNFDFVHSNTTPCTNGPPTGNDNKSNGKHQPETGSTACEDFEVVDVKRHLVVGVILTHNNSYHWSMPKVRPAIEYAAENINKYGLVSWSMVEEKSVEGDAEKFAILAQNSTTISSIVNEALNLQDENVDERYASGDADPTKEEENDQWVTYQSADEVRKNPEAGKMQKTTWRLKLIFADSKCSDHVAPLAAFDMYVNKSVNMFVGPACEYALAPVARYSPHWNIPVMTAGGGAIIKAFTNKNDFKLLTRMSSPNNKLGKFLKETLESRFRWKHFGIVFEDGFGESMRKKPVGGQSSRKTPEDQLGGTRTCYFIMEAVYDEIQSRLKRPLWRKAISNESYSQLLMFASQRARIILMCAAHDEVRKMLITADELGFNNGEYVFINIDLFSSKTVLQRPWYRAEDSDEMNAKARKAFEALMTVTLSRQDSQEYREFSKEVRTRSLIKYKKDVYGDEVNDYVGSFHDALILYALAANETIQAGLDPKNGTEITRRMWNRTFKGITGEVSIDANGDREEDYSILNMNPKTGDFEVVANYLGRSQRYERVLERPIYWPGNRTQPPPDIPKCGFDGRGCPQKEKLPVSAIIAIVLSIILFIVLISVTFLYRYIRKEAELSEVHWRVRWEDINFANPDVRPLERVASIHSLARKGSVVSHGSLDTLAANEVGNKQIFTATGHYKSTLVAIKKFDRPFTPTKPLLIRIKRLRDLQNDHIVRFIGVCIDHPNQSIITEYCQKGSLQDVLENDNIKLDRMFKFSLIQDLVRGISYLHNSDVRLHGNLKSSNCVVDSRFVLKITDFGFLAFRNKNFMLENDTYAYYRGKLWTAPEILRDEEDDNVGRIGTIGGTQKGDVYSFAIICQEVVHRKGPFWVRNIENMSPKEIVSLVTSRNKPYFRPTLLTHAEDGESCEDDLSLLIQKCWAEEPLERPDFNQIKSAFKRLTKDVGGGSLLDNLLSRMEQYACNLEGLVQERTADYLEQKRRAENLLYMMLPRSVASQLMQGLTVKAEKYDSVTIYFSDICGFTSLSAISTPMQVVDFLNDLYTSFDVIIEQFDVYKVETIGDAYMVVSGLPVRNGFLHAREISRMSLKLLKEVKSFKIRHRPQDRLMLRIGIHSGPVCAGVVGHKMPRYCLFGDTVNTASRMESNGEALKIHVSPETKEILDIFGTFTLFFRGPVAMKGKGEISTWWLLGEENPEFPELSQHQMVL